MATKFDFHKMDNIFVVARFRPSSKAELKESKEANEPNFISTMEVKLKRKKQKQPFKATLDRIFDMSTSQKKLFDFIGLPQVQAVLEGYNSTLFAYGQTGAGKTYTMFGPENKRAEKDAGLVQRCCTYLFAKLRKSTQGVSSPVTEWKVTASFVQIYKTILSDLLDPKNKNLSIKHNFQTNVPYVENLNVISVNSVKDILINLKIAESNRIVAGHKLSSNSSRSHMLLMINIEQKTRDGSVKRSKLNFGDLAGSEDARKALDKNAANYAERRKEAIEINKSLTALTTAINNLSQGQRPSYRTSRLTHILQDSLGGNSKTTIIVAASPHIMNRKETVGTLRFAMTAKTVKNKPKINKILTRSQLDRRIAELEAENGNLKARVIELETKLRSIGVNIDNDDDMKESNDKNMNQIDVLTKEIKSANNRAKNQQERYMELETRNTDLYKEIELMSQESKLKQEEINKLKQNELAFEKERQIMEQRNNELQNELTISQKKYNKSTEQMDKQIQRQRNNISMKQSEKKELEKIVQELNLQNTDLITQNELLVQQMNVLKTKGNKNVIKSEMKNKNNNSEIVLNDDEKNMEPAMLLLHRFAATEANDLRLTAKQRMEKTGKMMSDLSDDINSLMDAWLPAKINKRKQSKTLVFQIRQLIGHFNIMIKQMKTTEQSYQNDLRLDIKRRDQEIIVLKKETKLVHSLKDDLMEKNDIIENLQRELNNIRIKNEELTVQTVTQQDTMFEIQQQVRFLNDELTESRASVKELKEKMTQNQNTKIHIDELSDQSSDLEESDSSFDEESKLNEKQNLKRKPKMSMWRESLQAGDKLDCKRDDVWCSGEVMNVNDNVLSVRYDGWGQDYDEHIERTSKILAVYKSMSRMNEKYGQNKFIKTGYMEKEGGMFKTWRKRYFTLDVNGRMSYYHKTEEDNPISWLDVKTMSKTTRVSFDKNKQYGLEVYTVKRVWKFSCKDEKELTEWIQAINLFSSV